jgi:hypothetical protein
MELNDYVMDQEMRRRRRMLNDPANADVSAEFVEGGGLDLGGGLLSSNMMEPASNQTGLMEPATHQTTPMGPNAHTRPEGVVYNQPDEDIQASINEQLQKQILDEALSAEEWEKEKIRLIKEDNKLGMLVSLITGNSYKPLSFSNANARSSSARGAAAKKKETLEKSTIDSRLIDNPPRGQDEVIEFGNSLNLSPTGWAYLKSRADMYDWGDVVSWMHLNKDTGLTETIYSRKGNRSRNDELRNLGYTPDNIGEQRNDAIANATRDVAEAYGPFIEFDWSKSNKDTFKAFSASKGFNELIKNPATLQGINEIESKFTADKHASILMLNPVTGALNSFENTYANVVAKKKEGFLVPEKTDLISHFSKGAKAATVASIAGSIFADVQNITDPAVLKAVIVEAVATNPDVINNGYNIESMSKMVSGRLNVNSFVAENDAFVAAEFARLQRDSTATKQSMVDIVTGGVRKVVNGKEEFITVSLEKQKEYLDIIESRFQVPQWKNPVEAKDQTVSIVNQYGENITVSQDSLVTRDASGKLETVQVLSRTSADGMRLYSPKLEYTGKDDKDGNKVVRQVGTEFIWDPTPKFVEESTDVLRKNVTALLEKATEFNDAFSSYKSIIGAMKDLVDYDNLDVGGVDRHIGTLIIKLRDTSMVTEGEFAALAKSVGMWDAIVNWKKTKLMGHEFTPRQRSTMLLIATTWMESKLARANDIRARNHKYLVEELRGSRYDTDMNPESDVEPKMEAYIKSLEIKAGVPVDLLKGGEGQNFIEDVQAIIMSDTSGKVFELILDLDTPSRKSTTRTAAQEGEARDDNVAKELKKAIDTINPNFRKRNKRGGR